MLKTCSVCRKIHEFNIICKRQYRYSKNRISDKFRMTYEWKAKRDIIQKS